MAPIPGLMVVATMRTDYEQSDSTLPWSDDELAAGRVVTIELGPLSAEESQEPRSRRDRDRRRTTTWHRTILESTGGNPLYIEEVVRSIVAGGDAPQTGRGPGRSSIAHP